MLKATVVAILLVSAGTAFADFRGQVVCGVPANERITLTMQGSDEKWYGCGAESCPEGPYIYESTALDAATFYDDDNAYVCDVTAGISRATGVGTAYFYRTGTSMESGDYDARVAITAAGGGTGGTDPDPPGGGSTPVSTATASLTDGADMTSWSFNPRRPIEGSLETDISVKGYFNSTEATVMVILACHMAGDEAGLYTTIGESVGGNHFVSLELATTYNECIVAAGAVGADTDFQLAISDAYLLGVEALGTISSSSDVIRQQSLLALLEHGQRRRAEIAEALFRRRR